MGVGTQKNRGGHSGMARPQAVYLWECGTEMSGWRHLHHRKSRRVSGLFDCQSQFAIALNQLRLGDFLRRFRDARKLSSRNFEIKPIPEFLPKLWPRRGALQARPSRFSLSNDDGPLLVNDGDDGFPFTRHRHTDWWMWAGGSGKRNDNHGLPEAIENIRGQNQTRPRLLNLRALRRVEADPPTSPRRIGVIRRRFQRRLHQRPASFQSHA